MNENIVNELECRANHEQEEDTSRTSYHNTYTNNNAFNARECQINSEHGQSRFTTCNQDTDRNNDLILYDNCEIHESDENFAKLCSSIENRNEHQLHHRQVAFVDDPTPFLTELLKPSSTSLKILRVLHHARSLPSCPSSDSSTHNSSIHNGCNSNCNLSCTIRPQSSKHNSITSVLSDNLVNTEQGHTEQSHTEQSRLTDKTSSQSSATNNCTIAMKQHLNTNSEEVECQDLKSSWPHSFELKDLSSGHTFNVQIGNPNHCSLCCTSRCKHTLFVLRELYCVDDDRMYYQHGILKHEIQWVGRKQNHSCPICFDKFHDDTSVDSDTKRDSRLDKLLVWCRGCGYIFHHACQIKSMRVGNDSCANCKRSFHSHWMRGFQHQVANVRHKGLNQEHHKHLHHSRRSAPISSISEQDSHSISQTSNVGIESMDWRQRRMQGEHSYYSTSQTSRIRPAQVQETSLNENRQTDTNDNDTNPNDTNDTNILPSIMQPQGNTIPPALLKNNSEFLAPHSLGNIHEGFYCMECMMLPIRGRRYRCRICPRYSMCHKCYKLKKHDHHPFEFRDKHYQDEDYGWKLPKKQNSNAAAIREKLREGTERLKELMRSAANERNRYLIAINNNQNDFSEPEFHDTFDIDAVLAQYSVPVDARNDSLQSLNTLIETNISPMQNAESQSIASAHEDAIDTTQSNNFEELITQNQQNMRSYRASTSNNQTVHPFNEENHLQDDVRSHLRTRSQFVSDNSHPMRRASLPPLHSSQNYETMPPASPIYGNDSPSLYNNQEYVELDQLPKRILTEDDIKSHILSECSICLEEYKSGDEVRTLFCFHNFHVSCIDSWFQSSGKAICCICKTEQKILLKSSLRNRTNFFDIDPGDTETLNILLRNGSSINVSPFASHNAPPNRRSSRRIHNVNRGIPYSVVNNVTTISSRRLLPNSPDQSSRLESSPHAGHTRRRVPPLLPITPGPQFRSTRAHNLSNQSSSSTPANNFPRMRASTRDTNSRSSSAIPNTIALHLSPEIIQSRSRMNNSPNTQYSPSINRQSTPLRQSRHQAIPVEISMAIRRLPSHLRMELNNLLEE